MKAELNRIVRKWLQMSKRAIANAGAAIVVPLRVQRKAGIEAGDVLRYDAGAQKITITAVKSKAYRPTNAELSEIRNGEAEIACGEYVTLSGLLNDLDGDRRKVRAKKSRKNSR